jgi:hypothetical protein
MQANGATYTDLRQADGGQAAGRAWFSQFTGSNSGTESAEPVCRQFRYMGLTVNEGKR